MASKEEVQKRLAKLIRSMESHLLQFKQWDDFMKKSNVDDSIVVKHVDDDIKDFEEFFNFGDNESMKG